MANHMISLITSSTTDPRYLKMANSATAAIEKNILCGLMKNKYDI